LGPEFQTIKASNSAIEEFISGNNALKVPSSYFNLVGM